MRTTWILALVATGLVAATGLIAAADGKRDGADGASPPFTTLTHELPTKPRLIEVGNFDGDAHPDVVTITSRTTVIESDQLFVLQGVGDGTFTQGDIVEVEPSGGWPGGVSLDVGDVDNDDDLDVLLTNSPYFGNGTRLNDGNGVFDTWIYWFFFGGATSDAVLFDNNGDDAPDIFLYEIDIGGYLCFGNGRGNGSFESAGFGFAPIFDYFTQVDVGELDGDGSDDLIVASDDGLFVRLSTAGPGFVEVLEGAFRDVSNGDVTGDSIVDLVFTSPFTRQVVVLPGAGGGTWGAPIEHTVGRRPTMLVLAELNGDGVLDVAATAENDASLSVLFSDGAGGFDPYVELPVGRQPQDVAAADLDGDGDQDLVASSGEDLELTILLNGLVP